MFKQNKFLLLITCLAILAGGYLAVSFSAREDNVEVIKPNEEVVESEPIFTWRFTEADTNNLDGQPETEVFLIANYGENNIVEESIDTVDGGCSELEGERHEGDVSNTGKVQCYYAGLGQYYRITKNETSYLVERKLFEEALPDAIPPESEWEVVADFTKRF